MSTQLNVVAAARPVPLAAPRPATVPGRPLRRELLLVAAVTVLALALRLTGLGHESIWYDEAASLELARHPVYDIVTGAPAARDPGNPVGYFALLRLWLLLVGASIENARALSAVAGALGVPAVWLLARACRLPRPVGLLAALLVAASPPLVYLGQEARVFAVFATVAPLAAACVAAIQHRGSWWAWVGFAALGALMVHLHYYAAFVLAALGLYLTVWAWVHDRRALWKLALCTLAVVLAFAPWLGLLRWQLQQGATRSTESWLQHLALMPLFDLGGRTLVWKESGLPAVVAADVAVAVLVFAPAAWLLRRCRPFPWPVLAFAAGVPLSAAIVALKTPMIHSHYLSVVIPAVLLLVACALVAGWRQGARRLVVAASLALAAVTAVSLGRLYAEPHKDDWRGLAARVDRDGGATPAYFYEDIGADCFVYYDPARQAVRLTEPFDGGGGWERGGDAGRMRGQADGFWFVLYLPDGARRDEGGPVVDWLRREFRVDADEPFGRMRLLRCRPGP
jgi:4-amino-4-deoxy-L-arabinose transferase-like glycosyltransferase